MSTAIGLSFAFVDVNTEGSIGLETMPASTCLICTTLGVVGAVKIAFASRPHLSRFTVGSPAVASISGWTFTGVPGDLIDALGSRAAGIMRPTGAFINVLKRNGKICSLMSSRSGHDHDHQATIIFSA